MEHSPHPTRFPLRAERVWLTLAVGAAALAIYLPTLAPWLTWAHHGADGGDLIAAAMTLGVPHPTGYPTYTLLGRLFALLPIGPVAYRFNLLSALSAMGAAVLISWIAAHTLEHLPHLPRLLISSGVGIACAAGSTLWQQATITEVYAPAALWFAAALYLAHRDDLAHRDSHWVLLGVLLGSGLGVHLTLVLATPGLTILLSPYVTRRHALRALGGLGLGLLAFAYLPVASRSNPPVNWGAAHTWPGFWWLVSGRLYHGYLLGMAPPDWVPRLQAGASLWVGQWGPEGLALALGGAWALAGRDRRRSQGLLAIVGAYTLYAVAYGTADSYVYLIPAFLVAALLLGEGAGALWAWGAAASRLRRGAWGLAALPLLVAVLALYRGWPPAGDAVHGQARAWIESTLPALPPNALVITGDDGHTFALAYLQWVEGERIDLLVVDGDLWHELWYARQIAARWPSLAEHGLPLALGDLVGMGLEERPVVLTTERAEVLAVYPGRTTPAGWLLRPE